MKPFISTSFYGVMNYLLSFTIMTSPWLFGFSHIGGCSLLLPIFFGWLQFVMAVFSNNSHGFIKVFPLEMHFFLDVIIGSFLLASPFIFGFAYDTEGVFGHVDGVFLPQVILGGLLCIMGIFTTNSPFTTGPEHRLPQGQLWSTDSL